METIIKHSDSKTENNVLCQLEYDPSVKVAAIGILIKDGTEWWYLLSREAERIESFKNR